MAGTEGRAGVCLAELIAALSLGTDLGLGHPMEHVLRQCVIALGLGESFGLDESERSVVYYAALLAWVGCHASGREAIETMHATHCIVAGELARRLGLGEEVREALLHMFDRWDGNCGRGGLAGSAISRPVRLIQLADVVEVFHRTGGIEAAVAVARERGGTQFDPAVVERFCERAGELLAPLAATTSWDAVIEAQPGLRRALSDEELVKSQAHAGRSVSAWFAQEETHD